MVRSAAFRKLLRREAQVALCMLVTLGQGAFSQGRNNLWLGGYDNFAAPPWGGVDLAFGSGSLVISTAFRQINYKRTNANIADNDGNLLFSTNGAIVGNALGDTMLNGGGLSPSPYTDLYPGGPHLLQAALIVPKPESDGTYYIFHGSVDQLQEFYAEKLLYTIVDTQLDNGLGGITAKNQVALDSLLIVGKLTAVRHANGRDWWVLCHAYDSSRFYRMLITPEGIDALQFQTIGINRTSAWGQVCFSPDGGRLAYASPRSGEGLEIFDFDRCTGLLNNPIFLPQPMDFGAGGSAFSPNGRYLYTTLAEHVYQYDTQAADIAASAIHIAQWDGFYSPSPPFATMFDIAQLAPDGKIYMSTGNGTLHLHVIHDPDSAGLGCNIEQHGIELPRHFTNSLPNHPNYHLGPVDGSVCDSLGIDSQVSEQELANALRVYPNPSNGAFNLGYAAQAQAGVLEVLDARGRVALQERLPAWSTTQAVRLHAAPGMYHCRLRWGAKSVSARIVIAAP